MRPTLSLALLLLALAPAAGPQALAQKRAAPADQVELGRRFFAQDAKCRGLLREKRWAEAEAACRESVRLAEGFADQRELEKMGAFAAVGHSLMGQGRYREAAESYTRAVEASRPRLDDTHAEVGDMYFNVALARHMLRDLGAAREWYRRAEKTYRSAVYGITDEEAGVPEIAGMKQGYLKTLKLIFEYHLRAAEEAGDRAEADEIKKQLAELP